MNSQEVLPVLIPIDKLGKIYLDKIKIKGTGKAWLLSENGIELYCPVNGHTGKSFLENAHNDPYRRPITGKNKI